MELLHDGVRDRTDAELQARAVRDALGDEAANRLAHLVELDRRQDRHDGVIAALAAIGLTAILWLLASALFRQPPVRDTWYIVALSGDGAGLDVTLRALAQNRRLPVVLVDCGLTEEGRRAASLAVSDTVTLVTPSELPNLFTQETRKG